MSPQISNSIMHDFDLKEGEDNTQRRERIIQDTIIVIKKDVHDATSERGEQEKPYKTTIAMMINNFFFFAKRGGGNE